MNRGEQQAATAASATYGPAELARRAIHRRAVEAAIWGMPAVNYELMYREMVRTVGGGFNQILFWSRLLDWKNQTLTPNPDVIYLMPFINTKDVGPMVLEIPPADDGVFNGSVMNYWQAAIEDIGPGGVDKGEGGKYLVLPPRLRHRRCSGRLYRDAVGHVSGLCAGAFGAEKQQRRRYCAGGGLFEAHEALSVG
jgi:hypothetical protein